MYLCELFFSGKFSARERVWFFCSTVYVLAVIGQLEKTCLSWGRHSSNAPVTGPSPVVPYHCYRSTSITHPTPTQLSQSLWKFIINYAALQVCFYNAVYLQTSWCKIWSFFVSLFLFSFNTKLLLYFLLKSYEQCINQYLLTLEIVTDHVCRLCAL